MSRDIKIVSGGTDNHLMLVDLTPYGLTGKAVEKLLDAAHITANKNTIPTDPQSPFVTSGIRWTPRLLPESEHRGHGSGGRSYCPGHQGRRRAGSCSQSIIQKLTDKYPLI